MKRSLMAICLFFGLAFQAGFADAPRVPVVAASSSAAKAGKPAKTDRTVPAAKAAPAAKPWPHEASDLKADPNAVWGKLDNGLRYVILPTRAPGRAALQLYMRVGSLMEAKDQQGMAHFLEHMAFNGTKRFPAGQMIEYFQRLGMSFGAHTNAHTGFDQTVFKIELPRTGEEMTGEGLKLFRDFFDGMLLEKKEIDRERRVIFSEMLARNSTEFRAAVAGLEFTLPGTLVPLRLPIGKTESLQAMSRERFVDFYETWYTPGRATVVAVGNFDVKMVERLIKQNFADAKARRGEQPDPNFGKVEPTRGTTAKLQIDADSQAVMIDLAKIAPDAHAPDSIAQRRQEAVRAFGHAMLNARFAKLAAQSNSPIQSAGASFERLFSLAEVDGVTASCQPARWTDAMAAVEQELRRALAYGFTAAEFDMAKASVLSVFQAMADQAETRQAPEIAAEIVASLSKDLVVTSSADDLAFVKGILAALTKEECELALRKAWQSQDVSILLRGNLTLPAGATDQVLAAYRQSRGTFVSPPSVEKVAPFAYTDFGPAGQIVKREELKDLGIVQATFANNVRVNVKRTDREKDAVQVLVRFGGGLLELPADKPGLVFLANGTFFGGGLKAHSINELKRALADKNCNIAFGVYEDAFQLGGGCSSAALETELDVCTAYLTAPGFRPESLPQFLQRADSVYAQNSHTPEGFVNNDVMAYLHGDDPRFRIPSREVLHQLTLDDLKAWLKQPLESGYMEVAIVGDIDPERALQLAAKTFGTLPQRAAEKPAFKSQRQVKFPVGAKAKQFQIAAETPRAISLVCWPTLDGTSIPRERRLALLAEVLNDRVRLKVRQELGATYTPYVFATSSDVLSNFGFVAVELIVDPKQLPEIGPLVAKMAAELADGKIGDDEFERAIRPVLSSLDDLDNSYWTNLLSRCQENPERLKIARERKADYLSIQKSEIEALAKKYLSADKASVISVSPVAPGPVAMGK